jgi:hypothetical protein
MELDPKKHVGDTKQLRKDLDEVLQRLKAATKERNSRERAVSITKVQEAIMWLGMDLKAMHEEGVPGTENPYPESYNPASPKIEPTADGIKL